MNGLVAESEHSGDKWNCWSQCSHDSLSTRRSGFVFAFTVFIFVHEWYCATRREQGQRSRGTALNGSIPCGFATVTSYKIEFVKGRLQATLVAKFEASSLAEQAAKARCAAIKIQDIHWSQWIAYPPEIQFRSLLLHCLVAPIAKWPPIHLLLLSTLYIALLLYLF